MNSPEPKHIILKTQNIGYDYIVCILKSNNQATIYPIITRTMFLFLCYRTATIEEVSVSVVTARKHFATVLA